MVRRRENASETSNHPFRSLFDLMVTLVLLLASVLYLQSRPDKRPPTTPPNPEPPPIRIDPGVKVISPPHGIKNQNNAHITKEEKDLKFGNNQDRPESEQKLRDLFTEVDKKLFDPQHHLLYHRIRVEGHTNSVGKPDYNYDLSARRALYVGKRIIQHLNAEKVYIGLGKNEVIVEAVGYGLWKPIAPNETPQGKAKNRRIEIAFEKSPDEDQVVPNKTE